MKELARKPGGIGTNRKIFALSAEFSTPELPVIY